MSIRSFFAVMTCAATMLGPMLSATEARADTMEMTTYYPAPQGTYKKMTSNSIVLKPQAVAPASPVDGMIYFNSVDGLMYIYSGGVWGRLLTFSGRVVGQATLAADKILTGSWSNVIVMRFRTTKRGIYSFNWDGMADIHASAGKTSTVKIRYCGASTTLIQATTVDDIDDDYLTTNTEDFGGSTMLQLAANYNYCFVIQGIKRGNTLQNITTVKRGATMVAQELFAL